MLSLLHHAQMAIVLSDEDRQALDALISSSLAGGDNHTPIFQAASTGKHALVEACLRIGVDKNSKGRHGETPLMMAAKSGHMSVAKILIGAGADVNIKAYGYPNHHGSGHQGYTALHWASEGGHGNLAVELLRAGASIDVKCVAGETPLFLAVVQNHFSVVNDLLNLGADAIVSNKKRETALFHASTWANPKIVQALLSRGADVNSKAMDNGGNSLHALCEGIQDMLGWGGVDDEHQANALSTLDVLLRWGVDELATNDDGKTPADFVRDLWGVETVEEEDAEFPIRIKLARAPVDKAWYRRGWLVMLRARALLEKTRATQRHRGERLGIAESTHLAGVVHKLFDEQDEGVFRKVVSFV